VIVLVDFWRDGRGGGAAAAAGVEVEAVGAAAAGEAAAMLCRADDLRGRVTAGMLVEKRAAREGARGSESDFEVAKETGGREARTRRSERMDMQLLARAA
jgi:hypothetical protein